MTHIKDGCRRASSQEEQEPRRDEADRQLGLQAPPAEGDRVTYFLPTEKTLRVVAQPKAAKEHYKEQSATEVPVPPGPQQEGNPHGSSALLDGDAKLRSALPCGEG